MRAIAGREFARMIERRGWQLLRINGSHHIYGKAGSVVRLSVPFTATARSRPDCFGIWPSLPKFPTMS
jgi:predicted RNA binding protein YcfA (HicA-like mRNA interferase family)